MTQPTTATTAPSIRYKDVAAEKFYRLAFNHPKAAKTTIIALGILFSPVVTPVLTLAAIVGCGVGLFNGYGLWDSIKKTARLVPIVYDFVAPAKCDLTKHAFKVADGPKNVGSIAYEGDLPVLTLKKKEDCNTDYHHDVGYDQGYLMAEPMQKLLHKWLDSLFWVAIPNPKSTPLLIDQLKQQIPRDYLREIEGMAEGFNKKMEENKSSHRITTEKLLLLQLLPDVLHSKALGLEKSLKKGFQTTGAALPIPVPAPGCTTLLNYDDEGKVVFGRNMDWPSLGVAGTYTIMVRREHEGAKILEIGTPGLVGTITGISSSGLALAMNVAEGKTQNTNGLPACIFNRQCLEKCNTVDEVKGFVKDNPTLGPYHLTVATETQGAVFDFYQKSDNTHNVRDLKEGAGTVVTTNCRYSEKGPNTHHAHSKQREYNLSQFLRTQPNIEEALKLPVVNNVETVHHAIIKPGKGEMSVAINNGYAARDEKHTMRV